MRKIITNPFFIRTLGLAIGLSLGVGAILFFQPSQTLANNPYDKNLQGLQAAIALYHKNVNDLFNAKMKLLIKRKGTDALPYNQNGDLNPEGCDDQNVTTFCLSVAALDYFEDFEVAMAKRAKRFWNEEEVEENVNDPKSTSINDILITQSLRAEAISQELKIAEIALDRSLAAYNELRVAYPIHKQYEQIIVDLTKYRDALADVRDEIELYPSKLLDASTPSCG